MRLALARALFARLVSRLSCSGVKPPCCLCCRGAAWGPFQPKLLRWGVLEALQLCVCD